MIDQNRTLPKIKVENMTSQKAFKLSKLNTTQYAQQKMQTLLVKPKLGSSSRSRSLMSASSNKDSRKNSRIYLNLIQKKINQGNYDEKNQISGDLSSIKRKCSDYSNEIFQKMNQIQRLKKKVQEYKIQIQTYSNNKEFFMKKILQTKQRYRKIRDKGEEIINQKFYLLNMINQRKNDSINLGGKVQQLKQKLKQILKNEQILSRAQMQTKQKECVLQNRYKKIMNEHQIECKGYVKSLQGEQNKVRKKIQNQLDRQMRSKRINGIADLVEQQQINREHKKKYKQYLLNKFVNRLMQRKLENLIENNQRTIQLFRKVNLSYGPFSEQQFPKRFLSLQSERQKIKTKIVELQNIQQKLQKQLKQKKKKYQLIHIENLSLQEKIINISDHSKSLNFTFLYNKSIQAEKSYKIIQQWIHKNTQKLKIHSNKINTSQKIKQIMKILKLQLP